MKEVPKDMNLNVHINAPHQIMGLSSPDGVYKNQTSKGQQVPYPFLSALIDRKNFDRFNKRVVFDRSDYDDLLNQIVDQIHEKKQREMDERIVEKDDEQRQIAFQRDMMLMEKEDERNDKENKRLAFIQANKILRDERNDRVLGEKVLEQMEKLNYFPFTHGDMIEKQRKALNDLQKHEQLQEIREKQNKEKERKIMQTRLNAQANELMLLSFQREQFEEALQKSNTKPLKRMGNFQNDPTLE